MEYARWDALLSRPAKDGRSQRAHLEPLARKGNQSAIDELTGPDFPEELEYLWDQFKRLDSMREYGSMGPRRFTPLHIHGAMMLFDWKFQPHEVEALTALDVITLNPDTALDTE